MWLDEYQDTHLIAELEKRGYRVRHKSEGTTLSWHRTQPFPEGVDFRTEALEKFRSQLAAEHIHFKDRAPRGEFDSLISSAFLQIV